nr:hypothetical protein Iba_chr04aCG0870 [Ipomoea batatas]GMC81184.1 hypothetical protein Iba_chr04bCG1610 [Ipomoea batatas]GMC83481.1 hypothetical protein Iba_chr04cCG2460 [Ipomoea batatas]GMC85309.1 hypothetical protein Iba_chr04dCG0190 [Ipomoea batatas]
MGTVDWKASTRVLNPNTSCYWSGPEGAAADYTKAHSS